MIEQEVDEELIAADGDQDLAPDKMLTLRPAPGETA
jgi:hypothetical protein